MRNKLHYGLIPIYLVVLTLVLWINGVFTGQIDDVINLVINCAILAVIGVLFIVSTVKLHRISKCAKELLSVAEQIQAQYKEAGGKSLWNQYQDKRDLFQTDELKTAYAKYRIRMKSFYSKRGYTEICDVEEYINDSLLERVCGNHFVAAMPGTLTGLGILGTFLGLSIGLGSFNGTDIYAVTDNIGTLLGGMKVAFHTSVYGIFFSLIYSFLYRGILSDAYEKLEIFLQIFRQCVVPPAIKEDENYATMLVYQANLTNAVKQMLELMQGNAQQQSEAVERMVDQFAQRLSERMGSSVAQLGSTLSRAGKEQQGTLDKINNLYEAANAMILVDQKNQEAWKQVLTQQEVLARELEAQKEKLNTTCREISEDISNQLFTFEQMRNLYEK